MTVSWMGLSILTVLFLAMAREAYAITVAFLLLIIKGVLLLKYIQASSWKEFVLSVHVRKTLIAYIVRILLVWNGYNMKK